MKEIVIYSERYGEKVLLVDDEDYSFALSKSWTLHKGAHTFYARHLYNEDKIRKSFLFHRFILKVQEKHVVDHIDGNGLNNQKINLRICTNTQNLQNSKRRSHNASIYKGVHIIKLKKSNTYRANIRVNGKLIYLGCFKCEYEAAKTYDEAAIKYFGEYARLNKYE